MEGLRADASAPVPLLTRQARKSWHHLMTLNWIKWNKTKEMAAGINTYSHPVSDVSSINKLTWQSQHSMLHQETASCRLIVCVLMCRVLPQGPTSTSNTHLAIKVYARFLLQVCPDLPRHLFIAQDIPFPNVKAVHLTNIDSSCRPNNIKYACTKAVWNIYRNIPSNHQQRKKHGEKGNWITLACPWLTTAMWGEQHH